MARLAMFVDGWNFYWSLEDAGIKPYGWCDFALLARNKTSLPHATVHVEYFTSYDKPRPGSGVRQTTKWLPALKYLGCEVIQGEIRMPRSEHFEVEPQIRDKKWREKQTDIALASRMIADCNRIEPDPNRSGVRLWTPGYDEAVLLSGTRISCPQLRFSRVNHLADESTFCFHRRRRARR